MRYFKIITNYDGTGVSIDETELALAIHCFTTDAKGVFKNGLVRGKDIISIKEDWNKAMGWNPTYKLGIEDWDEIQRKGVNEEYKGLLAAATEQVKQCLEAGRPDLIGKTPLEPKQLSGGVKSIGQLLQ